MQDQTPTTFPSGYGKFPYIIIRIGSARYIQIPIHRVTGKAKPDLPGICISEEGTTDPSVQKQHNLDALMQVRQQHFEKHGKIFRMCLIEGPEEAVYVEEQGEIENHTSIPTGGVLLTGSHKILSMSGPHFK